MQNHVSFPDQVGRHEVTDQQNLAVLPQQHTTSCPDDNNNPGDEEAVEISAVKQGTPVRSFVVVEYMSLYQAAQQGDWEKAQELFNGNPSSMTAIITIESDTALLVAADHKQWEFVEKIVRCMQPEALGLKETKFGYTALHIVAREGKTRIAEAMVKKNNNLTQIRDNEGRVPLLIASLFVSHGKKETIEYLLSVTKDESPSPLSGPDGAALMCNLLDADYYDIALSLFHRSPKLVMEKAKNSNMWPLEVMAQRPFNFKWK